MKAKVIIEDGKSLIVLKPETEFEKSLIEDSERTSSNTKSEVNFKSDTNFHNSTNHRIEISITSNKKS